MQVIILEAWDYYDGFLYGLVEIDGQRYRAERHFDTHPHDEVWRYLYWEPSALSTEPPVGEFTDEDIEDIRSKEKDT